MVVTTSGPGADGVPGPGGAAAPYVPTRSGRLDPSQFRPWAAAGHLTRSVPAEEFRSRSDGRTALPRRAGDSPSLHEVGEGHIEDVGDQDQVVDARRVGALFDPVDRLAVEASQLAERLLCELPLCAGGSDMVSDGLSAGEYPGGQGIGWHAYTLVGAVIIVCTIVGTFERSRSGQNTTMI